MAAGTAAPNIEIERVTPGDPDGRQFTVNPEIVEKVEQAQRMEALRDIHLPEGVSPWPPATGWWVTLGLLVLMLLLARQLRRWLRRPNLRRMARRELDRLNVEAATLPPVNEAVRRVEFLRRVEAAITPPQRMSDGVDWLRRLERALPLPPIDEALRQTIAEEIYRPAPAPDLARLRAFTEATVAALPRGPASSLGERRSAHV